MIEDQWAHALKRLIRTEMARKDMSYGGLLIALKGIGVSEDERNLRNKVARGTFSAVFLVQCLLAMGVSEVRLEERDFADALISHATDS